MTAENPPNILQNQYYYFSFLIQNISLLGDDGGVYMFDLLSYITFCFLSKLK